MGRRAHAAVVGEESEGLKGEEEVEGRGGREETIKEMAPIQSSAVG